MKRLRYERYKFSALGSFGKFKNHDGFSEVTNTETVQKDSFLPEKKVLKDSFRGIKYSAICVYAVFFFWLFGAGVLLKGKLQEDLTQRSKGAEGQW